MRKDSIFNLVKQLSDEMGVVGYEEPVTTIIKKALKPYVDNIEYDKFGNLISYKKGRDSSPTIVIEAHVDEIGLIVSYIDEKGFIFFKGLGEWEDRILPAQRVRIKTQKNKIISGVIGMRPLHIKPTGLKSTHWEMRDLFIDIGASSNEDVEKANIRIGDSIILDRKLIKLDSNPDIITGKALDNRMGCACLIDVMEQLSKESHDANVYAIFSMETELGLKGALNISNPKIKPDIIIAFDTTVAGDVPGIDLKDKVSSIGGGVAIKVAEYHEFPHGFVVDPKLVNFMIETAEEKSIPYQLEILEEATTCATALQQVFGGQLTGALSIPTRYLHCPIELVDINDALATSGLAVEIVKKISNKYVNQLYLND